MRLIHGERWANIGDGIGYWILGRPEKAVGGQIYVPVVAYWVLICVREYTRGGGILPVVAALGLIPGMGQTISGILGGNGPFPESSGPDSPPFQGERWPKQLTKAGSRDIVTRLLGGVRSRVALDTETIK